MIYYAKDKTLATLLRQEALKQRALYFGELDNWDGPKTQNALKQFLGSFSVGNGEWPYIVEIQGNDLLMKDVVCTCFGGADDPQDKGETASGINTKTHPNAKGVSLAMDGRQFEHLTEEEHEALDGSPIPKMPWHTMVELTAGGVTIRPDLGVIDLGPGKQATTKPSEPHAIDLTVAAARDIYPRASATNFGVRVNVRIINAAQYLIPGLHSAQA